MHLITQDKTPNLSSLTGPEEKQMKSKSSASIEHRDEGNTAARSIQETDNDNVVTKTVW